jgi:hypothetical protein
MGASKLALPVRFANTGGRQTYMGTSKLVLPVRLANTGRVDL